MADESGNNNSGLYFIVGALVVVVGIGAYVLFGTDGGGDATQSSGSSTTIERTTIAPTPDLGVSVTQEKKESP